MYEDTVFKVRIYDYEIIVYETTPCKIGEPRSLCWEIFDKMYENTHLVEAGTKEYSLNDVQSAVQDALKAIEPL